ncbi:MAG: hypothetical protein QW175_04755 [Candidatus Bathyarchaeia archaeon]
MGVSDIYLPPFLNVAYVDAHQLWDRPLAVVRSELRETSREGKPVKKLALYLQDVPVPLLLNRTNATTLAKAWGDDYNTWTGKQLKLKKVRVQYRQEEVEAIRVTPA